MFLKCNIVGKTQLVRSKSHRKQGIKEKKKIVLSLFSLKRKFWKSSVPKHVDLLELSPRMGFQIGILILKWTLQVQCPKAVISWGSPYWLRTLFCTWIFPCFFLCFFLGLSLPLPFFFANLSKKLVLSTDQITRLHNSFLDWFSSYSEGREHTASQRRMY